MSAADAKTFLRAMLRVERVENLIRAHIEAQAEHNRLFRLNDQGLASDQAVSDALDPIDDSVLALCRARPTSVDEKQRRVQYLLAILPDETDGRSKEWMTAIYAALLDSGGEY